MRMSEFPLLPSFRVPLLFFIYNVDISPSQASWGRKHNVDCQAHLALGSKCATGCSSFAFPLNSP